MQKRVTVQTLRRMKQEGRKITMLTAYDCPFAEMADAADIDIILVGDSVGTVVQGRENTLPVTMEEMLYHTRMVARGAKRAMIVGDMPFLSYQTSLERAIENAGRFLKEADAHVVKLEGGAAVADRIAAMSALGIPVMAHIGLTPQSVHAMGGHKVQREEDRLLSDAKTVEEAGAFAIVLEGIPAEIAARVTASVSVPTIGIGAGAACDGQVLVLHDLLGLFDRFVPKFVKRYANLREQSVQAMRQFADEVRGGQFPAEEHTY